VYDLRAVSSARHSAAMFVVTDLSPARLADPHKLYHLVAKGVRC